ncbi:MAG TPA: glycosyltransferase family 39 protein, partial [Vicinamibacterales bacterium]|nr:glycosyltransferase family 39 protein [Vicinamibacterales bacterium]
MAYLLFTPVAATTLLHLTFYCLAVSALFVIVRRIAGSSNGIFAAILFGLYLPAIRAFGSDYVDGPVIAYALLTVALGLHGLEESKRWWTLASGIAAGLMFHSNVGALLLFPSILVWFVPLRLDGWKSMS